MNQIVGLFKQFVPEIIKFILQPPMPFFCNSDTTFKESYEKFFDNIKPCSTHSRPIEFVCLEKSCQNNMLSCSECVLDHRNHSFDKINKFFSIEKFDKIRQGDSKKHKHFVDIAQLTTKKLNEIEKSMSLHLQKLKKQIQASKQRFIELGTKLDNIKDEPITNHTMLKIKKYLEEQWPFSKCQKMKQIFDKVLNAIQDSFDNLSEDLIEFIEEEDWQNIQETQYKEVQEKWFRHLHSHKQKVVEYFKFDPEQKASNLKLSPQRLEVQYLRTIPGNPFIVCDNYVRNENNKWKILIKECDSKMLFFNASTIYVGVCKPEIVKRMAYSHLNEGGRGTYMIGSNGWAYHHTDPALDRQDIVGFTFGKGDEIYMEVNLNGRGKIKFKKLGKFFDNKFELPLNLDPKQMSKPCLKPIVGFSDEIGVSVRIININ